MAGRFHLIHHPIPLTHSLHRDLRPRRDLLQIAAEQENFVFNPDVRARTSLVVYRGENRIPLVAGIAPKYLVMLP